MQPLTHCTMSLPFDIAKFPPPDFDPAMAAHETAIALNSDCADAQIGLGTLLAPHDRGGDATADLEAAIAVRPNSAEGHNNLGVILNDMGHHQRAVKQFEQALAIDPRYPEAHNNLGNARLALGAVAEAIACYRAALALRPLYVNAMRNLGNALSQMGRYEEARAYLERALTLEPQSAAINNTLGNTLQKLGLWADAAACYERAIALHPDNADTWTNLAAAYNGQGLYEKALACCDTALAIAPSGAAAHNSRGIALVALDRSEEAMSSCDRAAAAVPGMAEVYANIGSALVEWGRIGEAIRFFDRSIALEPHRPKFQLCHVLTKRVTVGDPRIAALDALARDMAAMPDDARIDLHFARAKAYGDTGRHDEAFAELLAGNALKRRSASYDEAANLDRLERIARAWPRPVVESWSGIGHPSLRPVFILGMPRSGSTLVEQILASHPAVTEGGELDCFPNAVADALGPLEDFLPAQAPAEERAALLGCIADRYLAALDALAPGAQRVTDKMPANFACIGLIHLALPNARIVHTRRNALDTCLSCFATLFTSVPYAYDLGEIGRYWRAYDRLMRHWREAVPEAAILDVDYESLVSDFDAQARRIVAHCGLPWDDACLSFHTARSSVKTASAIQVRQPLYRTSVDRWRNIDPKFLEPLRAALGELDR